MGYIACDVPAGFGEPISDANATFRALLTAMSYPGRIMRLPVDVAAPAPLFPTTGAVLLALADLETPVWLAPGLDHAIVGAWLRFHCGCPLTASRSTAAFAVAPPWPDLDGFAIGTAESPEKAATVMIQVPELRSDEGVCLSGPGIAGETRLSVAGLDRSFWQAMEANRQLFPQGVDIVLAAPDRLACLPRTTLARELG